MTAPTSCLVSTGYATAGWPHARDQKSSRLPCLEASHVVSSKASQARNLDCCSGVLSAVAMDIRATVEALTGLGVRVHCLALGDVDLTSAAGKGTMGVLAAVAEFERDLLIERTQSGLARAKAAGKALGRPQALVQEQTHTALERLSKGPWLRWQRSSTRAGRPSCACATKPCKCAFERGPGPVAITHEVSIRSQSTASLTYSTPCAKQSLAMFPLAIARKVTRRT